MSERTNIADISWPEFERRIAQGAVVFVPVGATEQHGRHLPLGVDAVIPAAICERLAQGCAGLVAPTVAYGNRSQPRSGGGPAFPGTINISAATLTLLLRDILTELFRHGARRIVVVNGHYENTWPMVEAIELALDHIGRDRLGDLKILRLDHWELVRPETLARIFPNGYPGIELEHASVLETSLMQVLKPDLVDLSQAVNDGPAKFMPYDRFPGPVAEVPPSGVLSMTAGASAEKGEWLLSDVITRMEQTLAEEFGVGKTG